MIGYTPITLQKFDLDVAKCCVLILCKGETMAYDEKTGKYAGYIYKIYNDVNDKVYIGQTISTIKDRWHGHMSAAINEKRNKSALYNAMRKYGRDKFHIEELEKIISDTKENLIISLNKAEQEYILKYKSLVTQNGYNIEKGGDNKSVSGRKVNKYDKSLNYICTYDSLNEAGRQNNIDGCTIHGCCNHLFYTAGGFVWAYDGVDPVKPYYKKPGEYKKRKLKNKVINKPKSRKLPENVKHENKLKRIGYFGKIIQYNSFKEIINIFEDIIIAAEKLNTQPKIILNNCTGKSLQFNQTVLRFEEDDFDKFPRSKSLQAVTVYDMKGNVVNNFINIIEAERFVGCSRGELLKTLKRGGSYNGYMFSFYGEPLIRKTYRWNKFIDMCDDNWNIVKTFSSMTEANIYIEEPKWSKTLKTKIDNKIKYKNYYWKYSDEFELNYIA
jgi:group I intron endonuclease